MKARFFVLHLIFFLALQSASLARKYYIDPSAQYNGDGSAGTPAAGRGKPGAFNSWPQYPASAGDKYYQKCGTVFTVPWQDGIYFENKDASIGNETTFGAYYLDGNNKEIIGASGNKPIISGLTSLPGWNQETNWSHVGNNIWSWESGTTSPYRLWIDGTEQLMAGFNPKTENADPNGIARIDPNGGPPIYWCHDTYPPDGEGDIGTTLYVYSDKNPAITYSSMQGLQSITRIFVIRDSDHVIFENLDLRYAKKGLYIDRSNNVTVDNCDIGKGCSKGIYVRASEKGGRWYSSDYGVIKNCVIDSDYHFSGYKYESQGPNEGIELAHGCNNWKIHHNQIKNWGHSCINIYSTSSNLLTSNNNHIYENYLTAPDASHCRPFNLTGPTVGTCSNNKIYRNYIYDMPTRMQITADNNDVFYNIWDTMRDVEVWLHDDSYTVSGQGVTLWAGSIYKACQGNKIYNNVFYNCAEAAIRLQSYDDGNEVHYNQIVNNIFYNCGISARHGRENYIDNAEYAGCAIVIEAYVAANDDMLRNNIFRNNLIYNTDNGSDVRYKGLSMTVSTFNASDADGDLILDNFQSNPLFTNLTNGNFSVMNNSEAIGNGYNLGNDYDEALVPGIIRIDWPKSVLTIQQDPPWDIGALKYSDDVSPAPPSKLRIRN